PPVLERLAERERLGARGRPQRQHGGSGDRFRSEDGEADVLETRPEPGGETAADGEALRAMAGEARGERGNQVRRGGERDAVGARVAAEVQVGGEARRGGELVFVEDEREAGER